MEQTTAAARSKFKLSEVRLHNRYNKGTIAPNSLYWNNTEKKVSDPTIPTEANKIWSPLIYDGDEITDTDIACKNKIYTFETDWGSEDTPRANSFLIIGGYYEDDELPCYYRADLTSSGKSSKLYYALLRNHHYRVNIKDVPERGLETTEEAEGMLNCNIDIEVIPWDESNEIDVGFSGIQHHFSVSAHNFLFNEIGRTEDDIDNILMISTDYPEGWYVEKITNSKNQIVDWISFTQSSGSAGDNTEVKLLVSEAFHDRIAYVFLKADRFTYVVKVTQITPPQSNCYLVATNSSIAIPVFRVNQSQLGKQLGIDDTFDAELVWTDNANRISAASNIKSISTSGVGYTGHIIVETGSAEGNAVVAIKKNGVILWSWHVWVANYEPDVDAHGFMTRNLGALSQTPGELSAQGLLYQWGRKDPFPGSANWNQEVEPVIYSALGQTSVQKVQTPENANFGNSVKNPLTFYYTNTADDVNSWYQWESISSDTLWGQSMVKSVYDPSPPGWRVASGAQLSNLVTLGYEYDVPNWGLFISAGGGWFPSVICRGGSHGNLQWFAYNCLLMSPSSVVMSSYSYSYAYAVRCVREEDYYDY